MITGQQRHVWRAVSAASAFAILAAGIAPHAGAGAFPGDDGGVAFERDGNIWTIEAGDDEPVQRQLTQNGDARTPRWSPNGMRISFTSKAGTIKTMGADGSQVSTVLARGGWQPTWHRTNGKLRLAYVGVTAGRGDIYSIPAVGGTPRRLTWDGARTCGNSWPAFSADNRWFAYVQNLRVDGQCSWHARVVVVDRGTGQRSFVTEIPMETYGYDTWGVEKARLDFTSDSTTLVLGGGSGDCFDVFGLYNMATKEVATLANFHCEWESELHEYVPTPGGAFAGTVTHEYGRGMFSPTVSSNDPREIGSIDVRPMPGRPRSSQSQSRGVN